MYTYIYTYTPNCIYIYLDIHISAYTHQISLQTHTKSAGETDDGSFFSLYWACVAVCVAVCVLQCVLQRVFDSRGLLSLQSLLGVCVAVCVAMCVAVCVAVCIAVCIAVCVAVCVARGVRFEGAPLQIPA